MNKEESELLYSEINNLRELQHPNLLKLYEFFEDDKRYYVVTDLCKGGELFDCLREIGHFKENDAA